MKRVLGASRLSIIETFKHWCTPDHIMVLPTESLRENLTFSVNMDGTTAICLDCHGLWAAGYVEGPGTYTLDDLLPRRTRTTRYAPFQSANFTLHQLNAAVQKRVEWLREPFEMTDSDFERTRIAIYVALCHTPQLARLRELEQSRTTVDISGMYVPRPPFGVDLVTRHVHI